MDNYREKIIRIVERELKRTEEYQQRRDEYGNEEYILGCIMVKGDAFPKEVIAHAFVEDMGIELQFQVWRDEPRIRQKQAMWYDLTLFDVEGDFFGKLEQGYLILSVSDLFHCTAWNATEYLADEQNRDKENSCWKGMQRYLNYCVIAICLREFYAKPYSILEEKQAPQFVKFKKVFRTIGFIAVILPSSLGIMFGDSVSFRYGSPLTVLCSLYVIDEVLALILFYKPEMAAEDENEINR